MKAIILAGGRGKRLRPITDKIPKPLIPINNKPLIERTIKYLKKYGVTEIIISTGYKSNLIEKFLKQKKNFGCEICNYSSYLKSTLKTHINTVHEKKKPYAQMNLLLIFQSYLLYL